jgi:hypothetical protein
MRVAALNALMGGGGLSRELVSSPVAVALTNELWWGLRPAVGAAQTGDLGASTASRAISVAGACRTGEVVTGRAGLVVRIVLNPSRTGDLGDGSASRAISATGVCRTGDQALGNAAVISGGGTGVSLGVVRVGTYATAGATVLTLRERLRGAWAFPTSSDRWAEILAPTPAGYGRRL